VPEPAGGAHSDWDPAAENLGTALERVLDDLCALPIDELLQSRWAKYEALGAWNEE